MIGERDKRIQKLAAKWHGGRPEDYRVVDTDVSDEAKADFKARFSHSVIHLEPDGTWTLICKDGTRYVSDNGVDYSEFYGHEDGKGNWIPPGKPAQAAIAIRKAPKVVRRNRRPKR